MSITTIADVGTQVDTFFGTATASLADAQAELSLQLASTFNTSYGTVAQPSLSASITDIAAASALDTATGQHAISGDYNKATVFEATIETAFDAYITTLAAITSPPAITVPDIGSYTASVWDGVDWVALKSKMAVFTNSILDSDDVDTMLATLTSGTTRMQSALFQQGAQRRSQILRDRLSAANAATGALGFTYANFATTAERIAAQQDYSFGLDEVENRLVQMISDWAKTQFQFALARQIDAHASDVDFNIRYAGALAQVYAETAKYELGKFSASVERIVQEAVIKAKEYTVVFEGVRTNATVEEIKDKLGFMGYEHVLKGLGLKLDAGRASADYTLGKDRELIQSMIAAADATFRGYTTSVAANIDAYRTRINAARDAVTATSQLASSASSNIVGLIGA